MQRMKAIEIAKAVQAAGGRALMVGGAVRDSLLGLPQKDIDLEVYGLSPDALAALLGAFGRVDAVGASFGVLKLRTPEGYDFDVSIPRRENKAGRGHRGFLVQPDPTMTPLEAAARRDFTINSLAQDPLTGEILDPFDGRGDLRNGILRPTSEAFREDPLRVLRGMQFAARFGMRLSPGGKLYGLQMAHEAAELAVERVWGEWEKLCSRGRQPSLGLAVLADTWLDRYPELLALVGCPQQPQHHPEGDVFTHTGLVMDAAAEIAERDGLAGDDRVVLVLAGLCHDLGKPATTVEHPDGRITAHGHPEAGETPTRSFLARIGAPARIVERVVPLVREHMAHISFFTPVVNARAVRRLAMRLGPESITMLCRLIEADMGGRPPLPGGLPPRAAEIRDLAAQVQVASGQPAPILLGRHLIDLGVRPGPQMGAMLRVAFEAQLDGAFEDLEGAQQWARQQLENAQG